MPKSRLYWVRTRELPVHRRMISRRPYSSSEDQGYLCMNSIHRVCVLRIRKTAILNKFLTVSSAHSGRLDLCNWPLLLGCMNDFVCKIREQTVGVNSPLSRIS